MRSRDERFESQEKYKANPDPLSQKKATGQEKEVKRFAPKDFTFNDDNTATCPAGQTLKSPGIRHNKRLPRFNHRGREKVNTQWNLYCMVHNIEKLAKTGYAQ